MTSSTSSSEPEFTPSQTVGPFFGFALPFPGDADGAAGPDAIRLEGQLLDGAGEPVPDGMLELFRGDVFARCRTDAEGVFHFALPGAGSYYVFVFARGLLRHLFTRVEVDPSAEGVVHWDVRLQGEDQTPFFELPT